MADTTRHDPSTTSIRRRASVFDPQTPDPTLQDFNILRRWSSAGLQPLAGRVGSLRESASLSGASGVRRASAVQLLMPTSETLAEVLEESEGSSAASTPRCDDHDPLLGLTPTDLRRPSFLLTDASTSPLYSQTTSWSRTPLRRNLVVFVGLALFLLVAIQQPRPAFFPSSVSSPLDSLARTRPTVKNGRLYMDESELSMMQRLRAEHLWGSKADIDLEKTVFEHDASVEHLSTVIFIHGLGQTVPGAAFVPNALAADPAFATTRWVMPQAPLRHVTIFNSHDLGQPATAPGWFDMSTVPYNVAVDHDDAGFLLSARRLNAVIVKERALLVHRRRARAAGGATSVRELPAEVDAATYGSEEEKRWASKRIVLGGFSQGGAMALLTGLTHPYELGGLAVFSTVLPFRNLMSRLTYDLNRTALPVYWAHGDADPYLTYSDALACVAYLSPAAVPPSVSHLDRPALRLGLKDVQFSTQPGLDHSANGVEMDEVKEWLTRVLSRSE
ncbi:hypothetical protein JCM8097_009201 [Rhodosporidiobolus ruineniae]